MERRRKKNNKRSSLKRRALHVVMYALLERKSIYFTISLVFGKGIYKCKWSEQNEFIYSMRPVLRRKNSDEGRVNRKTLIMPILAAGKVTSHATQCYK